MPSIVSTFPSCSLKFKMSFSLSLVVLIAEEFDTKYQEYLLLKETRRQVNPSMKRVWKCCRR